MDIFHTTFTYTNANGDSFVWRDVGPAKFTMEGEDIVIQLSGRQGGHIGTIRVVSGTGEVIFSAGQDLGTPDAQACAALT